MSRAGRPRRWPRLVAAAALLLAGAYLYLTQGYPAQWRQVRPGMRIVEVEALCGPPSYANGFTKPDFWRKELPIGRWEMGVGHATEEYERHKNIVGMVTIYYLLGWRRYGLQLREEGEPWPLPPTKQ